MESEKTSEDRLQENQHGSSQEQNIVIKNKDLNTMQISQQKLDNTQIFKQSPPKPPIDIPTKFLSNQYFITSRPQYQRSCGMSSLVSIFNTLYSSLNGGKLSPLTVEQAYRKLNVIGAGSRGQQFRKGDPQVDLSNKSLHEYLNELDFGYFTYNQTLTTWFKLLCRIYNVKGRAGYFYKMVGQNKTDITSSEAKRQFVQKLSSGKACFIYHAHDHYFCPVGYELKNEKDKIKSDQIEDLWVIIGETAARFAPMRIVSWSEIQLDLSTCYPQRYDIRNGEKGVHIPAGRENEPVGGTFHCLLSFQRLD